MIFDLEAKKEIQKEKGGDGGGCLQGLKKSLRSSKMNYIE